MRARGLLAEGGKPTVAQLVDATGVSRASFYRAFGSRDSLLKALEVAPEPDARERVLNAALEMIGATGLAAMSMDEVADRAGVSRATLYRLFPGKSALFTNLIYEFSPLEPVMEVVSRLGDEPPDVVMPEIARTVYRVFFDGRVNRAGLLRALVLEVSSLAPDTEEAAESAIREVVGTIAMYVVKQMSEGVLRPMSPLLALQAFVGPIFFHLLTRPLAEQVLGLDVDGERAVTELADTWLRAMVA
ncbi:MAG TPA: TetR/AcrR family transcriptional regulator [Patescibacteria group bacterium]|nr:TetR/AcrR family transcriptional regulator [Patescibacteria group bacterium]